MFDLSVKQIAVGLAVLAVSAMSPVQAHQSTTEFLRLYSQQNSLLFKREYAPALDLLDRWIADGDRLAVAYKLRSETHLAMGLYGNAIVDANKAIELSPHYRQAYVARATVYSRMGDYDKAVECWQQSLQLADGIRTEFDVAVGTDSTALNGGWEHTNIGLIYVKQGKFAAALSEYRQAIRLESTNCTEAHFLSGLVYEHQDHLKEALAEFAQAGHQDPYLVSAWQHCEFLSEALGNEEDALQYHTAIATLTPGVLWAGKQYQLIPQKLTDSQVAAWKAAVKRAV